MNGLLLPVIPRGTEGEGWTNVPTDLDRVAYLLNKYGDRLADTVVCFIEEPEAVELVLNLGKKVVPCIVGDETYTNETRIDRISRWDRQFKKPWVDWVLDNVERFEGVQLGNCVLEVTNHFEQDTSTEQIIERICDRFPTLVGKLVLAPWHAPDLVRDMSSPDFPIRRALLKAGPWITVYWGYELMRDPPPMMTEWLSGIPAYSGINFSEGAASHNLVKLRQAGFTGCLFFLPVHPPKEQADRLMNLYLTDLR